MMSEIQKDYINRFLFKIRWINAVKAMLLLTLILSFLIPAALDAVPVSHFLILIIPLSFLFLFFSGITVFYFSCRTDSEVRKSYGNTLPVPGSRSLVRFNTLLLLTPSHWRMGYFYQPRNDTLTWIRLINPFIFLGFTLSAGVNLNLENESRQGLPVYSRYMIVIFWILFILAFIPYISNLNQTDKLKYSSEYQENESRLLESVYRNKKESFPEVSDFILKYPSFKIAAVDFRHAVIIRDDDYSSYLLTNRSVARETVRNRLMRLKKRFEALKEIEGTYSFELTRKEFWESVSILSDNPQFEEMKKKLSEVSLLTDKIRSEAIEYGQDFNMFDLVIPVIEAKRAYFQPLLSDEIKNAEKTLKITPILTPDQMIYLELQKLIPVSYEVPVFNSYGSSRFLDFFGKLRDDLKFPETLEPVRLNGFFVSAGTVIRESGSEYTRFRFYTHYDAYQIIAYARMIRAQIRIAEKIRPFTILLIILILLTGAIFTADHLLIRKKLNTYQFMEKAIYKGNKDQSDLDGALTLSSGQDGELSVSDKNRESGRLSRSEE